MSDDAASSQPVMASQAGRGANMINQINKNDASFGILGNAIAMSALVSLPVSLLASLSGTFLLTLPELVTPLKGHSLSPRSCDGHSLSPRSVCMCACAEYFLRRGETSAVSPDRVITPT